MIFHFAPLLLLFSCTSVQAEGIHVNLARRAPVRHDTAYFHGLAEGIRAKYGFATAADHARRDNSKRASTSAIPLINLNADAIYLGNVDVGTPKQSFQVVLDTGSSDFWVGATPCTSGCSIGASLYDASESSTHSDSGARATIRYGKGEVTGDVAQDTVSLGGFTVQNQTFIKGDRVTENLVNDDSSGIMGLAFERLAGTESTPFWQALAEGGELTSKEMSFWLARSGIDQTSQTDVRFGGVFTLGGTNSSLFSGDIEFLDLVGEPAFWTLDLKALEVSVQDQNIELTESGSLSAIDTGTSLIGGLSADVARIWNAVPGALEVGLQAPGFYVYPCDTELQVSLSFGGKSWNIDPEDMNLGAADLAGELCLGGIFDLTAGSNVGPGAGNPGWVIGDVFLKNVYSVFRAEPPSIGFAQLSSTAGGSGTAPPSSTPGNTLTNSLPTNPSSTSPFDPTETAPSGDSRNTGNGPGKMLIIVISVLSAGLLSAAI
ncbi:hypothetical protein AGABI2DRAFT_142735 [Agaricus bisporus var. bisporus H97]|uniref:hypothetical protein n=1 Tax=Agaricus bisporus var. bisporus (strain H97 / ATCC MYA-4626 / FGSC 10389) TaxID=936046 RepID=UPI00029F4F8E|nr:hypothetical protein AGABI2DRAFT_142735 [Agaricus bisporus var. bisporus H97]EKV48666.1 hypothetical protein AGABI2DRAFT_142735 [Agaricus bisporus var. bisporus H97]